MLRHRLCVIFVVAHVASQCFFYVFWNDGLVLINRASSFTMGNGIVVW